MARKKKDKREEITLKGREKAFREADKLRKRMRTLTNTAMDNIRREVKRQNYNYNARVRKRIKREFDLVNKKIDVYADIAKRDIAAHTGVTMQKMTAMVGVDRLDNSVIRKIIRNTVVDNLSTKLHKTNRRIRNMFALKLKEGIGLGKGANKLARELMNIRDLKKLDIPKHIKEIERALRAGLVDPSQAGLIKKVLNKHKKYIARLTRAGEEGFQHLGIGGATRKFARDAERFANDIESVTDAQVDGLVNIWKKQKALYHQKVVARNETNKAYISYNRDYMKESDHVIGMRRILSSSHPEDDICDEYARDYIFGRDELPEATLHPNDMCYEVPIFTNEIEETLKAA